MQGKYGRDPTGQHCSTPTAIIIIVASTVRVTSHKTIRSYKRPRAGHSHDGPAPVGIKLNAHWHWQVIIKNLQNMHEKPLSSSPTGARMRMELAREYQDRARLQGTGKGLGPHTLRRTRQSLRPPSDPPGPWRMWSSLGTVDDPPVDST